VTVAWGSRPGFHRCGAHGRRLPCHRAAGPAAIGLLHPGPGLLQGLHGDQRGQEAEVPAVLDMLCRRSRWRGSSGPVAGVGHGGRGHQPNARNGQQPPHPGGRRRRPCAAPRRPADLDCDGVDEPQAGVQPTTGPAGSCSSASWRRPAGLNRVEFGDDAQFVASPPWPGDQAAVAEPGLQPDPDRREMPIDQQARARLELPQGLRPNRRQYVADSVMKARPSPPVVSEVWRTASSPTSWEASSSDARSVRPDSSSWPGAR
jgi:hypothetical protein